VFVTEPVLDFLQFRRSPQVDDRITALHRECQRLAGAGSDDALHIRKAVDLAAIDRGHDVAGLETCDVGRAAGQHAVDARGCAGFAQNREQASENEDREDEVGDRTRSDDRSAPANILVMEAAVALLRRHGCERRTRRRACLGIIAEKLDVSTERDGRELPARPVPVVEADQFRTEAYGESQDLHASPARNQEVAQLMKENNDREDKQKRNDVTYQTVA